MTNFNYSKLSLKKNSTVIIKYSLFIGSQLLSYIVDTVFGTKTNEMSQQRENITSFLVQKSLLSL